MDTGFLVKRKKWKLSSLSPSNYGKKRGVTFLFCSFRHPLKMTSCSLFCGVAHNYSAPHLLLILICRLMLRPVYCRNSSPSVSASVPSLPNSCLLYLTAIWLARRFTAQHADGMVLGREDAGMGSYSSRRFTMFVIITGRIPSDRSFSWN